MYQRALQGYEEVLGPALNTAQNLAKLYVAIRRTDEAIRNVLSHNLPFIESDSLRKTYLRVFQYPVDYKVVISNPLPKNPDRGT